MSAPAMNPLGLPDRITTPFGGFAAIWSMRPPSSSRIARPSTLVDEPGLSSVSHTMPSASRSIYHAGTTVIMRCLLRGRPVGHGVRAHSEVADEGAVIGETHVRDAEILHVDPAAHEDEVEL